MKHDRALAHEASPFTKQSGKVEPKNVWTDIDNHELLNWVNRHLDIVDLYAHAMSLGKPARGGSLIPLGPATAAWYLVKQTSANGQAESWFTGLLTGAELPAGDIRLRLRQALQNREVRGESKPWQFEMLQWLSKAWNRRTEKGRVFVMKKNEPFQFIR
jgi:hypothetical protein